MSDSTPRTRRWIIPVVTLALLVLGTVVVTMAIMLGMTDSDGDNAISSGTPAAASGEVPSAQSTTSEDPAAPSGTVPPDIPSVSGDEPAETGTTTGAASVVSELADPVWVSRIAAATDIPERALVAYAGASLAVAQSHPGCGLGWNTLAAIGLVESEHGSMNGSLLGQDGVAGPEIIGVALNGDGVARIPDTDDGALDNDTTWDRAVGPMQFLPTTWEQYAMDGDGDGTPDVHNIDDTSLTAAVYLCETGNDLTQPDNWIKAVAAYNAGSDYNTRIVEAANTYSAADQ
ncbi:Transglycosylase SLT domain-containing protein [Micrococcales bacterium KH10]|nr:Transglycosylase SLT domain-containing protein [Micrococcales bacterium KH10]